jgi:hypothetical protein
MNALEALQKRIADFYTEHSGRGVADAYEKEFTAIERQISYIATFESRKQAAKMADELEAYKVAAATLRELCDLYVKNRNSQHTGEFIACITPPHASEMTKKERSQNRIWSPWDRAWEALGKLGLA